MVTEADIKKYSSEKVYKAWKKANPTKARTREYSVVYDAPGSGSSGRQIIRGSSSSVRKEIERRRQLSKQQLEKEMLQKANAKKLAEEKAAADELRQDMIIARREKDRALEAALAVQLRESLTRQAALRDRPFTQSEARQFMGGGAGIRALRAGARGEREFFKRTGYSLSAERKFYFDRFAKLQEENRLAAGLKSKYFEKRFVGVINNIPQYKTYLVDPNTNKERLATRAEGIEYNLDKKDLVILPPPKPSAFNVKAFRTQREKEREVYYDVYGLKGDKRNFYDLQKALRNSTPTQQTKVANLAIAGLEKDLADPNTKKRAEAALIIATLMAGPLIGAAIGTVYKTPSALAKKNDLEVRSDLTWKQVGKAAGIEFGKNALQSYLMMKVFGLGGKAIRAAPNVLSKISPTARAILANKFRQKVFQASLRKGLDVVGAQYLSTIGTDVVRTAKGVKQKKYKASTIKASGLLGDLVGFYGEKAVKSALRKVVLAEDPRLILTKGTKAKPFAIENRNITVERLRRAQALLAKGQKLKIKYSKATPVKEPRGKKIVTPEKRTARGVKIDVPTPAGYATYAVGKDVYIIPRTFLRIRPGNTPASYYKKWFQVAKAKGFLPTFKQLGLPKTKSPTIYKGSGDFLPRKKGESLKAYYARGQRIANRLKIVQVLIAPKTVLRSKQPELEIKTIFPNPKGVKAAVTRVKVGKDAFGHDVIIESVAPKNIMDRLKFRIGEKVKFKKESLKYLTNREAKIAKELSKRIKENYDFIYKSKTRGAADRRQHMLQVERNFRKILKQYNIKATDAEIKAVSRLHDILKLRGINVKDEPIIRKALLEGYLKDIPLVKKLTPRQLKRVANTIGFHQDVNPNTLRGSRMDKFTRAFINADRLDIVRTGAKVDQTRLFNLRAKSVPQNIRAQFNKLNKLKGTKRWTPTTKKKFNALVKKYPGLKRIELKIIEQNRAKYKKMTPKQKAKVRAQEREYTDYIEARKKYKTSKTSKKRVIPYRTSQYKNYKTAKYRGAYRTGYASGYKATPKINSKYKSRYGSASGAYVSGYKAGKSAYKTSKGTYTTISKKRPKSSYKTKTKSRPPTKKRKTGAAIALPKGFTKKRLSTPTPAYYVIVKRRGKLVKLMAKPLTKKDARDYLAYSIDNGLERSAWFVPVGKAKVTAKLPRKMVNYYGKVSKKLRPYKIRAGKRQQLLDGYIEKRGAAMDTAREKAQAQRLRAKARRRKAMPKKRTSKAKPKKRVSKTSPRKKKVVKKASVKRKVTRKKPVKRKTTTKKKTTRKRSTKKKKR